MKLDFKQIGIGAAIATAVTVGGYSLFASRPGKPDAGAPAAPALGVNKATLPGNHPPLATAGQAPPIEREGKVEVDRLAKFVHFRTGSRNVKDMLIDGKVLWVATSGGLIRYDTSTDKFRLFDNQNGLLSNGIFHVSKVKGKIVAGTYGGGLSLYDEAKDRWEIFNVPEGLGDAFVYDVLEASNGDVWIATWSGVNRVRKGALGDRSMWEFFTV